MEITLKSEKFKNSVYHIYGEGYPIILLHGFGEDARIWNNQVSFLSEFYKVIVPNLPGIGNSELPDFDLSMTRFSEFLVKILQQENIEKTILFGHSMGGYIAMDFIRMNKKFLDAVSLVHSTTKEDDDAKKENRRKSIKLIQNDGKEVFLKAMIPNLYSDVSKKELENELDSHLKMALKIPSQTLVAYYQAMIDRKDTTSLLNNIDIPIQFIIGKEDNAVPYQQTLALVSLPKVSSVEILQNVGHSSMIESPKKLNVLINRFVKYVLDSKMR
jgi:pimeloyl-ACP methyl ester carboxylesterase